MIALEDVPLVLVAKRNIEILPVYLCFNSQVFGQTHILCETECKFVAAFSPMMQQYLDIKKQYPDTLLFFRLGDFYEMFFDDAKTASKELELVLTGRECGQEERAPMCGVPYHSAESYIGRLVAKGYKVAICEQTEDAATAKGLVNRDVVRIITPGTVTESSMLDESKNNYIACVCLEGKTAGLCFVDVSTGVLHSTEINDKKPEEHIINEIARFSPAEIILNPQAKTSNLIKNYLMNSTFLSAETLKEEEFNLEFCMQTVKKHFKSYKIETLGVYEKPIIIKTIGAMLNYLYTTQKNSLETITDIDLYNESKYMHLDITARRNLELTESERRREKKGSLLWILDKTKTSMGKRLLRSWVENPLIDISQISKRLNAVSEIFEDSVFRSEVRNKLSEIIDIERIITRVVYASANAKELKSLGATLELLPSIKLLLKNKSSIMLREIYGDIDILEDVKNLIGSAIVDEPPFSVREGEMIKRGFNDELDSLHEILTGGKNFLVKIEEQEQQKTGIKKLKIGYNRVFGYYIEVLNSYKELVPDTYIRKQTLSNCERYITQELKELEAKVLSAQERIVRLEYELFAQVREAIAKEQFRIKRTAEALSRLDVLCSLADTAVVNNYERPIVDNSDKIEIVDGRHPVVEKFLDNAPFVPNNTVLDCKDNRTAIITGPNMAGKSTYMRQIALIVIMAQMGSFVPAKSALIGIVDGVFTRVGASDDLSAGQSTFMSEMTEVAYILKNATQKSLIILDEVGRGTSTYDGMSMARAIIEYVTDKKKIGAKTLFATHYHELTELESQFEGIKNHNIAVKKRGDDITFLRRIVRGSADGSYGIEVARLAGVPKSIADRAREILSSLEMTHPLKEPALEKEEIDTNDEQLTFAMDVSNGIIEELRSIDINVLTPIEALTILHDVNKRLQ